MTGPYDRHHAAFEGYEYPPGYVDLDALESNLDRTRERADRTPVRVASKSVRCRAVLDRLLAADGLFLNDHLRDLFGE